MAAAKVPVVPEELYMSRGNIPVTIKQLLECEGESVTIAGKILTKTVTILGLVRASSQDVSQTVAHIDDQTGVIKCVRYRNYNEKESLYPVPSPGTYCRVIGELKILPEDRYVVTLRFMPLTDLNELTSHMLEVIAVPMRLSKLTLSEEERTERMLPTGFDNTLTIDVTERLASSSKGMEDDKNSKK